MAGCSWSSKARGTRSQFRLNTEGLLPFKCTYPVHLTDVMDAVPSNQSDLRRGELVSPVRGTRTRAVREYEQTIEELKKENFDLKLRIFLLEENANKNFLKNKVFSNEDQDSTVQVHVNLQVEAETLKKQLDSKDQLLQQALDQAEKYASDLKELQDMFVQQTERLSQRPSEQEWRSLIDEKENSQKEIENLLNSLSEKEVEIQDANVKIEKLLKEIESSEARVKKRCLAIQGLAEKYHKDIGNVPKEVRSHVQSAVQAARECKEEDLNAAIVNFKASVFNLMPISLKEVSYPTLQKENVKPSRSKFDKNDSTEYIEKIIETLRENESLQAENDEKSKEIKDLTAYCDELKERTTELHCELSEAQSKVKELETKIMNEKSKSILSAKFIENAGKSNDIEELKEDILRLILAIEQKDKEITDLQQNMDDKDYISERKELFEHLSLSCSVNRDLMEHLRKLEEFMEELLLHKNLDSSTLENITETALFSRLSEYLDETKQLSCTLSGYLSVCESSKLFDPDETSRKPQDPSGLDPNTSTTDPNLPGRNYFQPSDMESLENAAGTGKRRLSYSTIHNSARRNSSHMDSENVVVLGTSNNEDLILLLNDRGDPEDVLIRNNHSHLDQNASIFNSGDQLRRRCWESSTIKFWNGEKSSMDQWCNSELLNPEMNGTWVNHCPSSDSDIWSEPDRDVSLQRIGIDVQKSPVTQKSPRRSRLRDKRTTDELSSQKNESSSSVVKLHWLKRRKSSDPTKLKDDKSGRLQKAIDHLSSKCSMQENKLDEITNTLQDKILLIETLNEEKLELSNCIDCLKEELKELKEKQSTLTLKHSKSDGRVTELSGENDKLKRTIQELEATTSQSDALCKRLKDELAQTRTRLEALDSKCSKYEKDLSLNLKTETEYIAKVKSVENEKAKLSAEIKRLNLEKNELLQSIQLEKESHEREYIKLNAKLEESSESVLSLRQSCKVLESEKDELLKAKEVLDSNLLSSYSSCDKLKAELKKAEESLKNMKSQCNVLEKELNHSSKVKQDFIKSLSSVRSTFLSNLICLTGVCKEHLNCGEGRFKDLCQNLLSEREIQTDKDEQIGELFESIISANAKFVQTIAFLSQQLQSIFNTQQQFRMERDSEVQSLEEQNNKLKCHIKKFQQTVEEDKSSIMKYKSEITSMEQELDNVHMNMETLRDLNKEQQTHFENIQEALKAKEKSLEKANFKLSSTEMQLDKVKQQLEKDQQLLNLKDNEITKLQERIFNLQTHVNNLLSDKMEATTQIKSLNLEIFKFTHTSDELRENSFVTRRVSGGSLDTSISSIASDKDWESQKNNCERYIRKIKDLKTKLSIAEKRIEMLEKEKSDLRKNLLDQVHEEKRSSRSSEENDAIRNELAHLKDNLKAKTSFIEDLKKEIFRTSNSLVDKEKEIKVLQNKLSSNKTHPEIRSKKSGENDLPNKYSDSTTESNIMMLKKQKWELIQAILKQQKNFYEHRNIHLGHFEKFKNRVSDMRAVQIYRTLSGSEPILNSSITANKCYAEKCDRTLKDFRIELELDVEYLQNFTIFLKRFFVPLVLQNFQQSSKTEVKNTYSTNIEVVRRSSDSESNDRLRTTAVDFPQSPSQQDLSDQESLSEETITLSRSGSLSPESFEDSFPPKYFGSKLDHQKEPENHYKKNESKENSSKLSRKSNTTGGSQDSIFQRSHFSSPDLGIESDPNHESSAPEQTEKENFRESAGIKGSKRQESGSKLKQWTEKQSRSVHSSGEGSTKRQGTYAMGDTLHAIGVLKHYELLKKEVQESLIGIKAILSRTGDGLQHISKYTSPRKNLEYSTFRAIKDVSGNIEVCLEAATKLVDKFWIAPCPSAEELRRLIQQNQEQQEMLIKIRESKIKQENDFKEMMVKLEHAERVKERMEQKISQKLIKTKKVIRRAEIKMLERGGRDPLPKYPSEESTSQNRSN